MPLEFAGLTEEEGIRLSRLRQERRFVHVPIAEELVGLLIAQGGQIVIQEGVPRDAIYHCMAPDAIRGVWLLRYFHESFEPVAVGQIAPTVKVIGQHVPVGPA